MLGTHGRSGMAAALFGSRGSREDASSFRDRTGAREGREPTRGTAVWALLLAVMVSLMAAPLVAAPTVWVASSLTRVRPDDAPGTATQINLYAAKGEYESFQIIVTAPAGGLSTVNVVAPGLGGPQATLYREHYLYLSYGSGDWASNRNKPQGPGWYPDGLIPFVNPSTGADLTGTLDAVPFSLAAGKNQPIWVDVYVPRTTAAGQYSGVFTVTSAQGSASVTLNLEVWNFALPVKPALKSCFMYWPASDGGQNRGVLQSDQELLRHRLNPVTTSTSYERSLIDNLGLTSLSLSFWSNASDSGSMAPAPSVSDVLAQKAQHQPDLYFYCYSADEVSSPSLYSGIKAWGRAFHGAGVDQLITMAPVPDLFDDGSGTGRSAVDDWVVLPKMYDAARTSCNQAIAKGDEVWSYNCLQQDDYSPKWLLDYAPINYRLQPGFINQSLNLTGLLYWRVDWWTSDPWNNVMMWSGYPAEGMLVYPGAQVGLPGQVAPSMRIKYLRDGVDDYDYIQLLKNAGQGAWALGIARTIGPDWTNWSRDPNAPEAARIQLGDMLDSLGGGGGGGGHALTVAASANPESMASGGTSLLSASATDSAGHGLAAWAWSDGGAGGSFSSSAAVQSPTYTAATNTSGSSRIVALAVSATCSGTPPATAGATTAVTVQTAASAHTVTVTAAASPTTVGSGGSTALSATATDNQGHTGFAWSWSDSGAGGVFSPSAAVQNPTYTAPANTTGSNRAVTLTLTATCKWVPVWVSSSANVGLTVNSTVPAAHTVTVTASASPTTVASGGTTTLTATATDNQSHTGFAWSWSDNSAGGTFLPSAAVQNPTYQAAVNTTGSNRAVTLTVTATCKWVPAWVSSRANVGLTVNSTALPHTITATASANPTTVASGGTTALAATATDSLGHAITSWQWSDGGAGGTFLPSATVQNPTYRAAPNRTGANRSVTLTVTAGCGTTSNSTRVSITVRSKRK